MHSMTCRRNNSSVTPAYLINISSFLLDPKPDPNLQPPLPWAHSFALAWGQLALGQRSLLGPHLGLLGATVGLRKPIGQVVLWQGQRGVFGVLKIICWYPLFGCCLLGRCLLRGCLLGGCLLSGGWVTLLMRGPSFSMAGQSVQRACVCVSLDIFHGLRGG